MKKKKKYSINEINLILNSLFYRFVNRNIRGRKTYKRFPRKTPTDKIHFDTKEIFTETLRSQYNLLTPFTTATFNAKWIEFIAPYFSYLLNNILGYRLDKKQFAKLSQSTFIGSYYCLHTSLKAFNKQPITGEKLNKMLHLKL